MKTAAIPGYEEFHVTDQGEVFGPDKRRGGLRRVAQSVDQSGGGYLAFMLSRHKERKKFKTHVLVATLFVGCRPSKEHEVRHINGIRTDNRAENLAWGTKTENAADRKLHGTETEGERNGNAKLTQLAVMCIRGDTRSHTIIAKEWGVHPTVILRARSGETWQCAGGKKETK